MTCEGRPLPGHVRREFGEFLRCGRLEHGFLRVRCDSCHAERLVAFSSVYDNTYIAQQLPLRRFGLSLQAQF